MAIDLVTGSAAQPDTGFDMVTSSVAFTGSLLDIVVPQVQRGSMLLAFVLRVGSVSCSDSTWKKVLDGFGSGPGDTIRLDVYARIADGREAGTVSFLSLVSQELQGGLVSLESATIDTVIEVSEDLAFIADTAPNAPAAVASLKQDSVVCVWSAAGAVTFTAPADMVLLDTYSSSVSGARSLLLAWRDARAIGSIDPGQATASPAATGRAFTVVLHYVAGLAEEYARMMGALLPPGKLWRL